MWTSVAALGVVLVAMVTKTSSDVHIGGLFNPDNLQNQHIAFKYAVDRINMDKTVLPHSKLIPVIVNVSSTDSYSTGRRVCELTGDGVAAIFGPQTATTAGIVKSICDTMEIPNLEIHWEPEPKPARCLLNLHPDPESLAKALVDVLKSMLHWKSFVVLYENDEGLLRVQELLKAHGPQDSAITVRQLSADGDNRPLLKEMQKALEVHFVLDCSPDMILGILKEAQEVNMIGDYYSYLLISLDAHTVDFSQFKHVGLNLTALRLVDPARNEVQYAVHDWVQGELRYGNKLHITPGTVKVETALMYDAVHLFARALHQLDSSQYIVTKPLRCEVADTWEHGFALRNYMKVMQINGMTGLVKFDESGRRTDFDLDVIEITREEFKKIGTWDLRGGVNITRTSGDIAAQIVSNLQNKTFIVSSRIGRPFLDWKLPKEGRVGNDRFEGYSFDLISLIAKDLNITFSFHLAADENYGSFDQKTKKWNGLIKDLLDRTADLAICDLTITYDREKVVDFTMPFMTLGISILFSKPVNQDPSLYSFLDPLSIDVWLYMATAYLGVSVLLFILARASPNEWSSSHPCLTEEKLDNKVTMLNSLWHNVGSLMQQGSDIAPQAVSTRMLAGMWWFFTLIMISSYIANLAASLTTTRMDTPIESVDDLAKQAKIKYGAYKGGATGSFFEKSNHSTYQRMWSSMVQARPNVFVNSNAEGVERVVKGKRLYAFLMESTQIEYETERNCNLTQVGGQLDSKGYGIAMPMDSPYRTLISGAVLKLQENGGLNEVKKKWWKQMYGGGACDTKKKPNPNADTELGLANVGGVFIVLAFGCAAAFLVAIMELLWNCRKIAVEEAITPWEALVLELKFAISMSETKPVRKKRDTEAFRASTASLARLR